MFDRREMQIDCTRMCDGELGQFKVMRRKQRQTAVGREHAGRNGMCQREAVEGRGPAADFIHKNERLRGGGIEDGRCFGHLDHEGRAPARQIVACADSREDPVDGSQNTVGCWHITAEMGEDDNQGRLAHERRFSPHVRSGDHGQSTVIAQDAVIGIEALSAALQSLFDDGVTPPADLDPGQWLKPGPGPVQGVGAFREVLQHIEFGDGAAQALKAGDLRLERSDQFFPERFFQRQRPVTRR